MAESHIHPIYPSDNNEIIGNGAYIHIGHEKWEIHSIANGIIKGVAYGREFESDMRDAKSIDGPFMIHIKPDGSSDIVFDKTQPAE